MGDKREDLSHFGADAFGAIPLWMRASRLIGGCLRILPGADGGRPALLLVKHDRLGDMVLFTGALQAIRKHFAGHRIVMTVNEACARLLGPAAPADEMIVFSPSRSGSKNLKARVERVRNGIRLFRSPYVGVLHPIFNTSRLAHQICLLARADEKVWFKGDTELIGETIPLDPESIYTRLVPVGRDDHELDKTAAFLAALGIAGVRSRDDIPPRLVFTEDEKHRAASVAAAAPGSMKVAVCPGARFPLKDWGEERFAELVGELGAWSAERGALKGREGVGAGRTSNAEHRTSDAERTDQDAGMVVFLLGGKEDRAKCERIVCSAQRATCNAERATIPLRVVNLAGMLSVRESAAVIAECDLCVGNDTFGLHAACAVGTPSVVIMWGGDFGRWTPWGDPRRHRMTTARLDCFGCRGTCVHPVPRCVRDVTVADVLRECRAAWGGNNAATEG